MAPSQKNESLLDSGKVSIHSASMSTNPRLYVTFASMINTTNPLVAGLEWFVQRVFRGQRPPRNPKHLHTGSKTLTTDVGSGGQPGKRVDDPMFALASSVDPLMLRKALENMAQTGLGNPSRARRLSGGVRYSHRMGE